MKWRKVYHGTLNMTTNGKRQRVHTVYSFLLETANSLLHWARNKKERMSLQMRYLIQSRYHSTLAKRRTLK